MELSGRGFRLNRRRRFADYVLWLGREPAGSGRGINDEMAFQMGGDGRHRGCMPGGRRKRKSVSRW
jgi:hypothetical protein